MHFALAVITTSNGNIDVQVDGLLEEYGEDVTDLPTDILEFERDKDGPDELEDGIRGYWVNPVAEWDWYEVGGRYADGIPTKDGGRATTCAIRVLAVLRR